MAGHAARIEASVPQSKTPTIQLQESYVKLKHWALSSPKAKQNQSFPQNKKDYGPVCHRQSLPHAGEKVYEILEYNHEQESHFRRAN